MIIIPAIDIAEGKCVRLRQGDLAQRTIYSDDPVAMARRWEAEGAPQLHIVDLDGAVRGTPVNIESLRAIVEAVSIPVQCGGGLRTARDVERVLALGVHWAIMGTSALRQPQEVRAALAQFGEQVIVGIDARAGRVAISGWTEIAEQSAVALAQQVEAWGVARLIYTDVSRDGMLRGPNILSLREIAEAVNIPIIASGGVAHVKDIFALKALAPLGVIGVIIGKALYEGTLTLAEALAAAGE